MRAVFVCKVTLTRHCEHSQNAKQSTTHGAFFVNFLENLHKFQKIHAKLAASDKIKGALKAKALSIKRH